MCMPERLQHLIIPPDSAYRLYEYQPGQFEPFLLVEHPGPDNMILLVAEPELGFVAKVVYRRHLPYCPETVLAGFSVTGRGTWRSTSRYLRASAEQYGDDVSAFPGYDTSIILANMDPDSISCDYEIAWFNTVSAVFPNAKICECFPHFVKNFKKCINSNSNPIQHRCDRCRLSLTCPHDSGFGVCSPSGLKSSISGAVRLFVGLVWGLLYRQTKSTLPSSTCLCTSDVEYLWSSRTTSGSH